jgi:hypothetical protein
LLILKEDVTPMRFGGFRAVKIHILVILRKTLRSVVGGYQCFGGIYYLILNTIQKVMAVSSPPTTYQITQHLSPENDSAKI